jgi:oxygen-independent coproporphyrinogen-3 oxidase
LVGDTVFATEQIPGPANWLEAVAAIGAGTRKFEALDAATRIEEILMMGLRLRDGLTRDAFLWAAGHDFEDVLEPRRLRRLIDANYLELDARGLRATADGLMRLNALLAALLA